MLSQNSIWKYLRTNICDFLKRFFWHFFGKNKSDNKIESAMARLHLGEGRSALVSMLLLLWMLTSLKSHEIVLSLKAAIKIKI